ncbi:MAG: BadF/BadG/BcrA/BcrD ATPase family protein [Mangrovibacterium sp.]
MKLIADSGSTKTDWIFFDPAGETVRVQTSGINPFFRSGEDIERELRQALLPIATKVETIYYYGAGIVNAEKASIIEQAFYQLFGQVTCQIYSDVVGAARAACQHEAGIACILGTGSNACYFDGKNVVDNIPPLGFILGDEGSGAVMGRNLLGDFFKRVMPPDVRKKFQERFRLTKDEVLDRVYRQERPNKYLAQFAVFLSEEINHPWCREFVHTNLTAFIRRNILMLPLSKELPVNFVGSVAFHFQEVLKTVLEKNGLTPGRILKEPIDGLLAYHRH